MASIYPNPLQTAPMQPHGARRVLAHEAARYVMAAVAAVAIACALVFATTFYLVMDREAQSNLARDCQDVAAAIDQNTNENNDEVMDFLDQQVLVADSDTRISLIDSDGTVLFDSAADVSDLDNHALRPEVKEALETGEGSAGRYSETLGEETLYHTVLLEEGSVLRLATTKSSVWGIVHSVIAPILLVLLAALALSALIGRFIARRLAAMLSAVDPDRPLDNEAPAELVPLLTRINDQRKRLQSQADERRRFTASVSHELKTPLTVVSGYAEIILNGIAKPEDVPKFAGFIHSEAQHMKTMVDDLLILSRLDDMETSDVRMDMGQKVSLDALAESVASRLRTAAEAKGVGLTVITNASRKSGEIFVEGNQRMIEELVRNLVENAIRYNVEHGFVRVSVKRDEIGRPVLSVADTGEGIPMQYREKIFERFFCVDESRSKETGGTGLGLAIVKHAAQLHGASVSVRSNYPRGTVFEVVFPQEYKEK